METTTMETMALEVTDLKQWRYCARVVWYRYCLPDIRPITDLMRHGIARHRDEEGREERRSLRTYGLAAGERRFNVRLSSARLGLRGRLDLAIAVPARQGERQEGASLPEPSLGTPCHPPEQGAWAEAVVVEYKDSEQRAGTHIKLQLAAYALLLEEAWGLPVRVGWFYHIPLRRAERVTISVGLRRQVEEAVAAVQRMIAGEVLPPPPASRRPCVSCEFRRFCNDVV
jgi:CRISPR-associated exonuclease Cas4